MLVPTAWPLPVLGTPNPVITQNTRGLTGFVSQHHFPASSSGPCGLRALPFCPVCSRPSSLPQPKNRWPLITLTWPVRVYILVLRPKEKNCLPRQLDREQHAAWKKRKNPCGFPLNGDFLSRAQLRADSREASLLLIPEKHEEIPHPAHWEVIVFTLLPWSRLH